MSVGYNYDFTERLTGVQRKPVGQASLWLSPLVFSQLVVNASCSVLGCKSELKKGGSDGRVLDINEDQSLYRRRNSLVSTNVVSIVNIRTLA